VLAAWTGMSFLRSDHPVTSAPHSGAGTE